MKRFIVEVPCTVVDRYFVFAEDDEQARYKMASRQMSERSTYNPNGDYSLDASAGHEPYTHWERAAIVGEVQASGD